MAPHLSVRVSPLGSTNGLVQQHYSGCAWERGRVHAEMSVLLALRSRGEVGRGLQLCEPVAAVRLCCFLLQNETKLGTQLSTGWWGDFMSSSGDLFSPSALRAALLPPSAGESGWLTEPCGRGYSWMAKAHAQQPPLMPHLVLQKTRELKWWNEEEVTFEFLYTWFVGALKVSRTPRFCRCFHATLINSVSSSFH